MCNEPLCTVNKCTHIHCMLHTPPISCMYMYLYMYALPPGAYDCFNREEWKYISRLQGLPDHPVLWILMEALLLFPWALCF